jgi:CBS domain-containing protein
MIPVREIMSTPVVTVFEDETVDLVARLMGDRDLGSIIVTDREGNPMGIITERDIVVRVTARNLLPSQVRAGAIISRPLRTIEPEADIKEAAEAMRKYGIRRLVVMERDKMVGIISSKDIVSITPMLIEILVEKAKIRATPALSSDLVFAGNCDRCGQWSDSLREIDGRLICEECRIELYPD